MAFQSRKAINFGFQTVNLNMHTKKLFHLTLPMKSYHFLCITTEIVATHQTSTTETTRKTHRKHIYGESVVVIIQ